MKNDHIETLRRLLATERGLLLPGAPNALGARIIADLGFKAVYLTGAGLTNMYLGIPDLGFMDLSQATAHTMAIREITDLPLIVDADTGFGNAVNVSHTVKTLERAGASAIQIEDQHAPKRCGHFEGKELISRAEMVGKIKAAVDARQDGVLIMARTDARAGEGFESAIDRCSHYVDAGADIIFLEAPQTLEEIRQIPKRLAVPHLINMVIGGKTPILDQTTVAQLGFSLLLYANAALQGAVLGMQNALRVLRDKGTIDEGSGIVATFAERQRLVGKPEFDAMERRYAAEPAPEAPKRAAG